MVSGVCSFKNGSTTKGLHKRIQEEIEWLCIIYMTLRNCQNSCNWIPQRGDFNCVQIKKKKSTGQLGKHITICILQFDKKRDTLKLREKSLTFLPLREALSTGDVGIPGILLFTQIDRDRDYLQIHQYILNQLTYHFQIICDI